MQYLLGNFRVGCHGNQTWSHDLNDQSLQLRPQVVLGRGIQNPRMSFRKQTPSEFLKQIIGKPVVVKLNSGVDYRGMWVHFPLEETYFMWVSFI